LIREDAALAQHESIKNFVAGNFMRGRHPFACGWVSLFLPLFALFMRFFIFLLRPQTTSSLPSRWFPAFAPPFLAFRLVPAPSPPVDLNKYQRLY
jgi:hypothetical protein